MLAETGRGRSVFDLYPASPVGFAVSLRYKLAESRAASTSVSGLLRLGKSRPALGKVIFPYVVLAGREDKFDRRPAPGKTFTRSCVVDEATSVSRRSKPPGLFAFCQSCGVPP